MTPEEEITQLRGQISGTPADSAIWYQIGRIEWKTGNRAQAITAYNKSLELDPTGPAAIALEQARAIMNFYNKDLYNP